MLVQSKYSKPQNLILTLPSPGSQTVAPQEHLQPHCSWNERRRSFGYHDCHPSIQFNKSHARSRTATTLRSVAMNFRWQKVQKESKTPKTQHPKSEIQNPDFDD
mmetsp:Transcript_16431/g.25515  ORF Transcript_16431/g.25515 Transcript_16431/m.25515 type:complete len:104 (-) Transcript_16431:71-382(-)